MTESNRADLTRILHQQESLRAIIESISSELELRPLLTRIVQHACGLLSADRGTIGLVDVAQQRVRTEAVYKMPPGELGMEMARGVGLAGKVLATQEPVVLNHYGELDLPVQPDLIQDAVIGLPIFWRGKMIGFFGIGAEPPRVFGQADVELLMQLARHAAIAIENARLFAVEKRRAARQISLNRIGKLLAASLDLDELLQTAVSAIGEELSYGNTAVLLLDRDDPNTLVLTARSGIYADNVRGPYSQSRDAGIIGAAAQTRRAVLIPNVHEDPRYIPIPGAHDIQSELALPIVVGKRLLGVLNIEANHTIDQDEAADMELVADQLGVAISNAYLFEETQRNLAEARLLYETSRRITASFDVDDVIEAYLQHVAVRGQYICTVALYEFAESGERTAVIVRGTWSAEDGLHLMRHRLPYRQDALDPLLDAGQTIRIRDVYSDPRCSETLRALQRETGRPALAMIPLIVQQQRIGLVILSYPVIYDWSESDLWPYQVTAAQLAVAIDTRRQQLLLLRSSQQVAVLQERQRLARELHDSVTQLIFSITLIAQSIAPAWSRDRAEGENRVNRLLELSQSSLAEMRALLFELRSPEDSAVAVPETRLPEIAYLRQEGLVTALRRHVETLQQDGLTIAVDVAGYRSHPPEVEVALFRITQEALHNVVKHARATQVAIHLSETAEAICLEIADDGVGFRTDTNNGRFLGGLGMHTMGERAEALGGYLKIRSAPGEGTAVIVHLPQKEEHTP